MKYTFVCECLMMYVCPNSDRRKYTKTTTTNYRLLVSSEVAR